MFWRHVNATLIFGAILSGCTSTSSVKQPKDTSDQTEAVTHSTDDGSIGQAIYLDGADPNDIAKCRKVATTGSRLRRTVCSHPKDDSDLFGVIDTTGTYGTGSNPY